jgi:hypothetical protein
MGTGARTTLLKEQTGLEPAAAQVTTRASPPGAVHTATIRGIQETPARGYNRPRNGGIASESRLEAEAKDSARATDAPRRDCLGRAAVRDSRRTRRPLPSSGPDNGQVRYGSARGVAPTPRSCLRSWAHPVAIRCTAAREIFMPRSVSTSAIAAWDIPASAARRISAWTFSHSSSKLHYSSAGSIRPGANLKLCAGLSDRNPEEGFVEESSTGPVARPGGVRR